MHEMGLAQALFEEMERVLAGFPPRARAARATLEVGAFRAVVPDALRFCFEIVSGGSRSEGAELVIEEIPIRVRCPSCARERTAEAVVFLCPACGAPELVVAGKELLLRSVEIEEDEE